MLDDVHPKKSIARAVRPWRFLLRSDSLSLNFTATVAGPKARPHGTDRLTEPALLERWFCEAHLPPLFKPLTMPQLEDAKTLREAIFRSATARMRGATVLSSDILEINAKARAGVPPTRLGPDGRTAVPPESANVSELLGMIARDAIDLLTGPYKDRIRKCESPRCQVWFVDRSPLGTRRWCAMSPCGDQASAKAYRRRKKAAEADLSGGRT